MRDITSLINNTKLKNSTYKFIGLNKTTHSFSGPFYTPRVMTNFSARRTSTCFHSITTTLHDVSHIIDLYERGKECRLLQEEFGWPIRADNVKWTNSELNTEIRVLTLQSFLSENLFGKTEDWVHGSYIKKIFRKRSITGDYLPTKREWDEAVAVYDKEIRSKKFSTYINIWKDACRYTKSNRKDT